MLGEAIAQARKFVPGREKSVDLTGKLLSIALPFAAVVVTSARAESNPLVGTWRLKSLVRETGERWLRSVPAIVAEHKQRAGR
jgi:hypothetical protein